MERESYYRQHLRNHTYLKLLHASNSKQPPPEEEKLKHPVLFGRRCGGRRGGSGGVGLGEGLELLVDFGTLAHSLGECRSLTAGH